MNTPQTFGRMVHIFVECFLARRVRTDERLVYGVKSGGRQPGSTVGEGLSLLVDQNVDVKLTQGGQHDTNIMRTAAMGGAARSSGGGHRDQPPPDNPGRRV
jgi:hypothetical protein